MVMGGGKLFLKSDFWGEPAKVVIGCQLETNLASWSRRPHTEAQLIFVSNVTNRPQRYEEFHSGTVRFVFSSLLVPYYSLK